MQWNGQETSQCYAVSIRLCHHSHSKASTSGRNLFGHAIEGVYIGATAQQTLPQHKDQCDPNARGVEEYNFGEEVSDVDELEDSHEPDFVDFV